MSWRRLPHRQLNTHVLPQRVMGQTRQERWLNRTGGPVRPRQNYTHATRDVCCAARFATPSRRDDRQCWRRVDMWARLPGRQSHRQPHGSRSRTGPAHHARPQALSRPSSTDRACAASMAAMSAARTPCRSSSADRGDRRAARAGDRLAQLHRVLPRVPHHHRGAQRRLHHQVGGQRPRQAEQDARVDHGLDQVEEVGRPAARQRRDGVLLALGHPAHLCRRRPAAPPPRPGAASPACAPAESTLMPSSTSAGVLGMTRTTGTPAGSAASIRAVGTPAATDTTRCPSSTHLGQQRRAACRCPAA